VSAFSPLTRCQENPYSYELIGLRDLIRYYGHDE